MGDSSLTHLAPPVHLDRYFSSLFKEQACIFSPLPVCTYRKEKSSIYYSLYHTPLLNSTPPCPQAALGASKLIEYFCWNVLRQKCESDELSIAASMCKNPFWVHQLATIRKGKFFAGNPPRFYSFFLALSLFLRSNLSIDPDAIFSSEFRSIARCWACHYEVCMRSA